MGSETDSTDSVDIEGRRVDVYKNLHKNTLSVLSRDTGADDYGTVIDHVDTVVIDDPNFVVNDAGRQRAREQKRRNVHAYVRGVVAEADQIDAETVRVVYDPFHMESFQTVQTNETVVSADRALVNTDGVWATGDLA